MQASAAILRKRGFESWEIAVTSKVREVVRVLLGNGFVLVRRRGGSHRKFKGIADGQVRSVTVAGNDGDDVSKGTLSSIGRQSGLPRRLFR